MRDVADTSRSLAISYDRQRVIADIAALDAWYAATSAPPGGSRTCVTLTTMPDPLATMAGVK